MEEKEAFGMNSMESWTYSEHGIIPFNYSLSDIFNLPCDDDNHVGSKGSSLGFTELLGMPAPAPDFGPSSTTTTITTSDNFPLQQPSFTTSKNRIPDHQDSDILLNNLPPSPNSSSISSSSTEVPTNIDDQEAKTHVEVEDLEKKKKQLKPKKKNQKRLREPRVAFMTKSEVDHLEDGYRWRKYGQKAVKNSPYPRSYYRCTNATCVVKKRVERSSNDSSIVITTYEGQHTHPSPVIPRGGAAVGFSPASTSYGSAIASLIQMKATQFQQQQQVLYFHNTQQPHLNNFGPSPSNFGHERSNVYSSASSLLAADHGLLQDVLLPPDIRKEDLLEKI